MKSSRSIPSVEPSYFDSIREDDNSLSLESYGSTFTTVNESVDSERANSWFTSATTSRVEAWDQYQYDFLLY